ncbi:MAG: hypothetical protein ACI841_001792 [Planctomycetota bacterium]|jgi:hypothetical protein
MRAIALGLIVAISVAACQGTSGGNSSWMTVISDPDAAHPTGQLSYFGPYESAADFHIRVADAPLNAPDVLGHTQVIDGVLIFTPRFPFQPGLEYCAHIGASAPRELQFSIPEPILASQVEVGAVSPASKVLPSNALKFYLHFTGSMRRGEAYRHVRLLDDEGDEVSGAFIEIEPELWNFDRTRLTLLIDPGRIKRGLLLHESMGPVLYPGRDYVIEVDSAWRDGRGAPLLAGMQHSFSTIGADLQSPAPFVWKLSKVRTNTRDELIVTFDEALDRALAERTLLIVDAQGEALSGESHVVEDQTKWRFRPAQVWSGTTHELVIPNILEDLAGNSVGRPFEVETSQSPAPPDDEAAVHLRFTPN